MRKLISCGYLTTLLLHILYVCEDSVTVVYSRNLLCEVRGSSRAPLRRRRLSCSTKSLLPLALPLSCTLLHCFLCLLSSSPRFPLPLPPLRLRLCLSPHSLSPSPGAHHHVVYMHPAFSLRHRCIGPPGFIFYHPFQSIEVLMKDERLVVTFSIFSWSSPCPVASVHFQHTPLQCVVPYKLVCLLGSTVVLHIHPTRAARVIDPASNYHSLQ